MSYTDETELQALHPAQASKGTNDAAIVLEENELAILDRQLARAEEFPTPFKFLLSCATESDLAILLVSLIASIGSGLVFPISDLLLGNMGQSFRGFFVGETTLDSFNSNVTKFSLLFVYLAAANLVASFIAIVGFTYAGERIVQRLRQRYLDAILRQNIAFFDTLGVGEVNHCITTDTNMIQDAITAKASFTVAAVSNFCGAIVISFIKSWRLALVLLPSVVLIMLAMGIGAVFMVNYAQKAQDSYGHGANIAEEAISSIATVSAFGMQSSLLRKFDKHVAVARVYQFRSGVALGVMMAIMNATIWWTYGLAFWQGSRYLVHGQIDISAILTIMFATITGAFALGNVAPHVQAIVKGLTSTRKLSEAICRQSPTDPGLETGHKIDSLRGDVSLTDIRHVYPSRPGVVVMDGVSMHFPAGKTTAIVGPSGSGKSTVISLLERYFEPVKGNISIDGHDLTGLNLTWLRQQIGLVSQEPTLFSTTVFENIRYGLVGTRQENKPLEEVERLVESAAKTANAYDFIMAMPDGFQSHVGNGGSLLSGGQKQRITIARAIIGDPKILLLDEATSALDSKAEREVQTALNNAALGRTTIVIAHRLSTIAHADNIIVMSAGRVVEQGTHQELLERQSLYYDLTRQQGFLTGRSNGCDHLDEDDESMTEHISSDKLALGERFNTSIKTEGVGWTESKKPSRPSSSAWQLARFCFNLNKRMVLPICGGLIFSIVAGGSHPTQSVFLAKIMEAMSSKPSEYGYLRSEVNFWSLMYVVIGCTTVIGLLGQCICFVFYSEHLTYEARRQTFDTILHQDMGSFYLPAYSTAKLSTVLSHSATQLQGMGGVTLGTILIILTIIVAGIILSVSVGWKLGLVCMSTIPVLFGAGIMQLKSQGLLEAQARKVHEASAHFACEYSTNIRTVAALTLEEKVRNDYREILIANRWQSLKLIAQSSFLFALSQSAVFLSSALAFWYGSRLVAQEHYTMFQFYLCYTALVAGSYSAGAIFTFIPDMGKAGAAARAIKDLHDRKILIDPRSEGGDGAGKMDSSIQLRNVTFRYPNREDHLVLNDISLTVQPGHFAALVGASGSGKSTVVSLLERFFDPETGSVAVGGKNIKDWNLNEYRSQLALVGQMPTLYEGTIRENIALDVNTNISEQKLQQACKDANILDYIVSLPDGFETQVGARGTLLSGGQKQRIAIARALLRDPKILLLDEATSALDSESERVVQAALDEAVQGRTTLAVAHRISTVQRADCIHGKILCSVLVDLSLPFLGNKLIVSAVLDGGRIVESGTHRQLMSLGGRYYELVQLQSIEEASK
ncbi:hypothetical protein QQS21_000401 [Conoideocrella luteorostrata]|uniref:P-loop containing nucleoside triphosphate hydrolase protein n=1 Tax=Conoideocrella luteorostrata TaxID=1105319 RepID=A0AAJ0CZ05_9HYPO|nr:hypothetical protein QQS21_000401 [Conoideocrella luteorostrata]